MKIYGMWTNSWNGRGIPIYTRVLKINSTNDKYIARRLRETYGSWDCANWLSVREIDESEEFIEA